MKPNLKRLTMIILLVAFAGMVEVASAFYDPGLQRWVNRDPIGETGGMNLYGYVANAPFSFVDPYGLENWFTRLGDGIVGGFGYNAYHGSLEVGGRMALDDMARKCTDYGNYKDWNRDWRERHRLPNDPETAQSLRTIGAVGKLTGGVTELYVGMATSRVPGTSGAGSVARVETKAAEAAEASGAGKLTNAEKELAEAASTLNKSKQCKKLSPGEIKKLQNAGIDPHDLKENSKFDLFKDEEGNIIVKPKDGSGPGDPTGYNINNLNNP